MVLISGSFLDEHLADCIKARMIDHPAALKLTSGFDAPLGTDRWGYVQPRRKRPRSSFP